MPIHLFKNNKLYNNQINQKMIQEFENLWGKPIPEELRKLIEFQEKESDFENYSQGFGVDFDDRSGLKYGWSDTPDFLERLYPFAQANGTGSFYAIWDDGSGNSLADMPVVVFGDEGGQWVVAQNFSELLQLLTYDREIYVDHACCYFYKDENDEDYEESEDADKFRNWLQETLNISSIDAEDEIATIVIDAQAEIQEEFNEWLSNFDVEVPQKPTIVNEEIPSGYNHDGDKYEKAYKEEEYSDGGDYDGKDYSEVEAEFNLLEFKPRLKEPYTLAQYEKLWVDFAFETNVPCQIWLLQPDGIDGTYCPLGSFYAGSHKVESVLNFVEIPKEGNINHLRLSVSFINGQHLEAQIPFDCKILPPSNPEEVNDGEGTTELNGEVTLVVGGNTLRLNEPHQISVGALVEVIVPYKTGAKHGIALWATPIKEEKNYEEPITYHGSEDYYGPWGVAQASFIAEAPFKAEYLHISSRNNIVGKVIFSKKIPINIEFVDTTGDGENKAEIHSVAVYTEDVDVAMEPNSTINTDNTFHIGYHFTQDTQHGVSLRFYGLTAGEPVFLAETALITNKEHEGYVEILEIEEPNEFLGIAVVMLNAAGEILTNYTLDFPIKVVEYERERPRATHEEQKPKSWFQKLFGG